MNFITELFHFALPPKLDLSS